MTGRLDSIIATDEVSTSTLGNPSTAAEILRVDNEDRAVQFSRKLVMLVLITAGTALGSCTYIFSKRIEIQQFETQFENQASEIITASNEKVQTVFNTLETLSNTATSLMLEQQQKTDDDDTEYPAGFFTFPNAKHHLGTTQRISGALLVAYLPRVQSDDYDLWKEYSEKHQGWIREANFDANSSSSRNSSNIPAQPILPQIWDYPEKKRRHLESTCDVLPNTNNGRHRHLDELERIPVNASDGPFSPVWTFMPPPSPNDTQIINYNMVGKPVFKKAVKFIEYTRKPTFLDVCNQVAWFNVSAKKADLELQTVIVQPIFEDFTENSMIIAHLVTIVPWRGFFEGILAPNSKPVAVVMENTCDEVFTFQVHGSNAALDAEEDTHHNKFDKLGITDIFAPFANSKEVHDAGLDEHCIYSISIYPTRQMEDSYISTMPVYYTVIVLGVFLFTSSVFLLFDILVTRRQNKVMSTAVKHNTILSSLFPKRIHDRIMAEVDDDNTLRSFQSQGKTHLKAYLNSSPKQRKQHDQTRINSKTKPIADLFPETTIMFADIAGFTAWSSTREPSQVFMLLESIYCEFDTLASQYQVFKVETIGDCYVAVSGLPDPCEDHAVVMATFSREALKQMHILTAGLEVELGPDTTDLDLRVGLHSGPVTAGVLRGERARFQLFGDTMNTASRMESTGVRGKIQVSQETATLLTNAGKADWLIPREEAVVAKGKGELKTYFLNLKMKRRISNNKKELSLTSSSNSDSTTRCDDTSRELSAEYLTKCNRRIDWMVEIFANMLHDIAMSRMVYKSKEDSESKMSDAEQQLLLQYGKNDATVLAEVKEIIALPEYNAKRIKCKRESDVKLSKATLDELREYICRISYMYSEHSFHCFEHASHVTMSVLKLFSRIVAPDVDDIDRKGLHDHTYGITSDPLTRFAVVLSALIHDVEHPGVPNSQLVKEGLDVATRYNNQSVAEQNSVDIAWDLLMMPEFKNLRRSIYINEAEFRRFRKLVVNTVMATDIMDRQLKQLRNDRWDKAFNNPIQEENCRDTVNRKATIVIEHLIQASDVAHTMQHWHVYRRWNENLFKEMYRAYENGRSGADPSERWYEGELWFLDNYVIPLARKLKECGVFGVSSDELLAYAQQNRKEWETRGRQMVAEMMESAKKGESSKQ